MNPVKYPTKCEACANYFESHPVDIAICSNCTSTLRRARAVLSTFISGLPPMTISVRDGEYRVNFKGGREVTAYYTDDLHDAVCTAIDMGKRQNAILSYE